MSRAYDGGGFAVGTFPGGVSPRRAFASGDVASGASGGGGRTREGRAVGVAWAHWSVAGGGVAGARKGRGEGGGVGGGKAVRRRRTAL